MNSIRNRLLATLLIGTIIVLLGGGFALHWLARNSLTNQQDQFLNSRAQSIAILVTYEEYGIEFENEDDISIITKGIVYSIEDTQGNILDQSPILDGQTLSPWNSMPTPKTGTTSFYDSEWLDDQDWRVLSRVIVPRIDYDDAEPPENLAFDLPQYIVTIASPSDSVEQALAVLIGAMTAVGLAVIGVICLVLWLGIRAALSPLIRLGTLLSQTDARSLLEISSPTNCPQELQPIYLELNRLMTRIRSTLHWERLFTDAASHELRTPLAELQSITEVAQRWPEGDRPIKALAEAHQVGLEMQQMVESLLQMTRARNTFNDSNEQTLIRPIIDRVLIRKQSTIAQKNFLLNNELTDDASLNATPETLKLILGSLIENTISHTPPNGTISFLSNNSNESSCIIFKNGPVDLSAEDIENMTKPFWRKDAARTDREHVGLGLSVVQRMCDAVGLQLSIKLDPNTNILSVQLSD